MDRPEGRASLDVSEERAAELGAECARKCKPWLFGTGIMWGDGVPIRAYQCKHRTFFENLREYPDNPIVASFTWAYNATCVILVRSHAAYRHLN